MVKNGIKNQESGKKKLVPSYQLLASSRKKIDRRILTVITLISTTIVILAILWSNTDLLGDNVELNCSEEEPLSDGCLREYARDIGLKGSKFDKCYEEAKFADEVESEYEYGQMIGVRGGPSFFIGEGDVNSMRGFYVGGARDYDYFAGLVKGVEEKGIDVLHDEFIGSEFGSEEGLLAKYKDAYSKKGLTSDEIEEKAKQAVTRDIGAYELKEIETQEGLVLGSKDANIVLMEFSEFDCEYCAKFANETFPKIRSEYINDGKVRFVFRDFPLAQEDSKSYQAANAARCAEEQDSFWEFREKIFIFNY